MDLQGREYLLSKRGKNFLAIHKKSADMRITVFWMYEYSTPGRTMSEFSSFHQLSIVSLVGTFQFVNTGKHRYVAIR